MIGLPSLERGKAPWQVTKFLQKRFGKDLKQMQIAQVRLRQPSLIFYLKQSVPRVSKKEQVESLLASEHPSIIITPEKEFQKFIKDGLNFSHYEIWRKRVWIAGKNSWKMLLIISNKEEHAST